uniref:Uncharacterized protein n=1 Tax=Aegilops tauschii subsp. strangulata TaxID=200361 RepID=A0A453DV37_AEGTS
NKIRHLRQFLRGWAKHWSGVYKVEKERLLTLIDAFDLKVDSSILTASELESKVEAEVRLKKLLHEE